MCDIDRRVVEISKVYFADTTASAFSDPRVTVVRATSHAYSIRHLRMMVVSQVFHDAAEYIKGHVAEYDVIIVDSSDPVGPAESLYTKSFYTNMAIGLKPGGVIATQVWAATRGLAQLSPMIVLGCRVNASGSTWISSSMS